MTTIEIFPLLLPNANDEVGKVRKIAQTFFEFELGGAKNVPMLGNESIVCLSDVGVNDP
jgi:hypothetical protein